MSGVVSFLLPFFRIMMMMFVNQREHHHQHLSHTGEWVYLSHSTSHKLCTGWWWLSVSSYPPFHLLPLHRVLHPSYLILKGELTNFILPFIVILKSSSPHVTCEFLLKETHTEKKLPVSHSRNPQATNDSNLINKKEKGKAEHWVS